MDGKNEKHTGVCEGDCDRGNHLRIGRQGGREQSLLLSLSGVILLNALKALVIGRYEVAYP